MTNRLNCLIECSAQPLCISFHPYKDIVAAGLVDGTVEVHDVIAKKPQTATKNQRVNCTDSDEDETDTILSSIFVGKEGAAPAKFDSDPFSSTSQISPGPSCPCVLFSKSPHEVSLHEPIVTTVNNDGIDSSQSFISSSTGGGEYLFTACNKGSLRCLDSERVCSLEFAQNSSSPFMWSMENAHNVGVTKLSQLPYCSPCGPLLVTGDDVGTVRLWDARTLSRSVIDTHAAPSKRNHQPQKCNAFDNLMKPPAGRVMQWKVNHDYITDFETNGDGSILFASSADGTLSVFDLRFVNKQNMPRSVISPDADQCDPTSKQKNGIEKRTWEKLGYTQSDNQDDELLSLSLIKNQQKLLCGSQQGTLSFFSHNHWGDISDRFPDNPHSIDVILKIDEETVFTGSSDGLIRAVRLLPNSILGVLGGHGGFPVEGLEWTANRQMVGSVSHDEYIRLWDTSFLNNECSGKDLEMMEDTVVEGIVSNNTQQLKDVTKIVASDMEDE